MESTAEKTIMDALREIIALSVENQIKLEALERVFKETNPLLGELYRGEIETLTEQNVKRKLALTEKLRDFVLPK